MLAVERKLSCCLMHGSAQNLLRMDSEVLKSWCMMPEHYLLL